MAFDLLEEAARLALDYIDAVLGPRKEEFALKVLSRLYQHRKPLHQGLWYSTWCVHVRVSFHVSVCLLDCFLELVSLHIETKVAVASVQAIDPSLNG